MGRHRVDAARGGFGWEVQLEWAGVADRGEGHDAELHERGPNTDEPLRPDVASRAVGPGHVRSHDMALDEAGRPVVAFWQEVAGENHLHVFRWTGVAWASIGSPLRAAAGRLDSDEVPALALGPDGNPTIAWSERDATP